MAVTATLTVTEVLSGDENASEVFNLTPNTGSPGQFQIVTFNAGNNALTVPASGSVPTMLIIQPLAAVALLTLKGANADTGIPLSKVNPSFISVDSSLSAVVINASVGCNVRIRWI